ncbi:MAG: hypothetical protein JNM76_00470 [Betaproteobacteria bacterium]|nr:hypothetical protein [Betaproteobacteria bacterium]
MDVLAIFYAPMAMVTVRPMAPFIIAAVFALLQVVLLIRQRALPTLLLWRRPALFAAAIWVVYGLYELQVQATQPYANIRIDLLVLAPILYVFTVIAIWWIWREFRGAREATRAETLSPPKAKGEPPADKP